MAKEVKIKFSREHTSKSNPQNHVDVYREKSDSSKTEKIDHADMPTDEVPIHNDNPKDEK